MHSGERNGAPDTSILAREMMMFVELAISVTSPPSSAANDNGISRSEGEALLRLATWIARGIRIASAAIFLMKLDRNAVSPPSTAICMPVVLINGILEYHFSPSVIYFQ